MEIFTPAPLQVKGIQMKLYLKAPGSCPKYVSSLSLSFSFLFLLRKAVGSASPLGEDNLALLTHARHS